MPAATTRNFSFICGQDDFLVGRMGRQRFEELSGSTPDEFSREVVNGFAANVDEVETAVNRFREAVLTIPMFGGRRGVWLKDVNFLADTVTGKRERTARRGGGLPVDEVHKLAAHANGSRIEEASVAEMTPNAAQGDFFEMADAFFSGDLQWTLAALKRHFFAGGDARPVLSALQNRNRILIQLRALMDAGEASVGPGGVAGLQKAAATYGAGYGDASGEKSSFNVFTQNPWYLGKLAGAAPLPPLRRLIDNQREFIDAFEEIIRRPAGQEEVLRDMAVRCLAV